MDNQTSEILKKPLEFRATRCFSSALLMTRPNPFLADHPDDESIAISVKALDRLILLASETASRFERQDIDGDPVAWMYAPQALFDGRPPVEACRERGAFLSAMNLHLADLQTGTPPGSRSVRKSRPLPSERDTSPSARSSYPHLKAVPAAADLRRDLYTSTIVDLEGETTLHVFHATMAPDPAAVRKVLAARYGLRLASMARTLKGFDPSDPIAVAMVADALGDTLEQVAADSSSPLADGLDIQLEARFID